MSARRSMVFYAWLGLAVEFVLVVGVVAFVLAGAAYQRSAILLLSQRVQRMQLANQTLQSEFLNTQRALRGYRATGQVRFADLLRRSGGLRSGTCGVASAGLAGCPWRGNRPGAGCPCGLLPGQCGGGGALG